MRSRGSIGYQDGPSWLQELHLSHVAISRVHWVSRRPFRPEIAKSLRCFSVKLHRVSRRPFRVENCIWSYKGLSRVRLSASASFRVAITFQEFLQVSFLSKPSFTKLYIIPYLSTRVAEAFFDLVHISSIPTNPTRTLQESRSFIWKPWHIDLSLALLQKDLTSFSCVVLYSDLLTQQASHRGYCDVVRSLTWALSSSTSSQPFPTSLTVSFTFPCSLDSHIRFCEENPAYQCSCSPFSKKGRPLENIRSIEIHADILSEPFIVRSVFSSSLQYWSCMFKDYLCIWIRQFPYVVSLNIITDQCSLDLLPSLFIFRLHCQQLLEVTFSCNQIS